ncbi:cyclase family protein [Cerasicoccus frondis]|uniref:cyclase family protein n=1 Tax=Cerasicoccus frondis TaxID=490090 RepID=UPI002852957D|nr:cyclase family protein [Cerasicoccus frondis]
MKIISVCLLAMSALSAQADHPLWDVYQEHLKAAKYVDLTHAFAPVQPVWPGFGEATFSATVAGKDMPGYVEKGEAFTIAKQGFRATAYVLPSDQYGTQLDPPAHWNPVGATISDLPPTFAVRPLVVISIVEQLKDNAGYELTIDDIIDWEKENGLIPEGAVVMVRSDWYKKWSDVEHFTDKPFPGVSLPALKFLHLERHILFHGHEPLDTDDSDDLEGEAWLMHHNFAQAEGVMNLDQVPEAGALVAIGYAKPLGGTGGFARYIAICPPDWPFGVSVEEAPGAPLPVAGVPLRRNAQGVLTPGGKPNLIK